MTSKGFFMRFAHAAKLFRIASEDKKNLVLALLFTFMSTGVTIFKICSLGSCIGERKISFAL
jgi:hypothetical protein